ncbi:MAG: type II/IV secretion system protein [Deltaproteobacteria bacterium]|nr:type II/IV secretion system protein [Deltaproteobacteria bacterium]
MGLVTEEQVVAALSKQLGYPLVGAREYDLAAESSPTPPEGLNLDFLARNGCLYLGKDDEACAFATTDPLNLACLQHLEAAREPYRFALASETQFRELAAERGLRAGASREGAEGTELIDTEVEKLREMASEAPVVNLVNALVSRAVVRGASDLHLEPYKNMARVRYRIDGILHDEEFLPIRMQLPVVSRIKILAGLDIAEKRIPQDGKIELRVASKNVDIRVSTLPVDAGEGVVMRFLARESLQLEPEKLGLEPDLLAWFREDIAHTSGVILVTGPTGSGKSTTLYSALSRLNREEVKIITIEDPVEYRLDGVNQIQVKPEIGYDFPRALRSILRQDPDVIMVGEIRDAETARIAMQSSLTGHLVFSTLHTNDAPTSYTRLIDLGVEEYLLNSTLVSVVAQRLVRKLCDACAAPLAADAPVVEAFRIEGLAGELGLDTSGLRVPVGCRRCGGSGYRGRVALMEYLRCTDAVKVMPKDGRFPVEARAYMKQNRIRSLWEDGVLKALRGVTSVEEVIRVAG